MAFTPIFKPFTSRPHTQDVRESGRFALLHFMSLNFDVSTWLLAGATVQAIAVYFSSSHKYILLASSALLLAKLAQTILQTTGVLANPYLKNVVPGRVTALAPNSESGNVEASSDKKIAVLHLGAKSNHPLGLFAPQFAAVGKYLNLMNAEMDAGMHKGFLGQTTFHRKDDHGALELVLISYWESIEDLWAFAHHGTVHREAWLWWEKTIKLNNAVGINHEIFEADAKHWENVYVNFQPTMQGATTYVKRGKDIEGGVVGQEWVSPLIDARKGKLAKSSGRMGREISIYDDTRVAKETYA